MRGRISKTRDGVMSTQYGAVMPNNGVDETMLSSADKKKESRQSGKMLEEYHGNET